MAALTDPREVRARSTRALGASLAGSSIEWYDYLLYGTVAPLVLAKRFFPATNAASGLLLTYGAFAIPFFLRPVGGILFSHIGDRKGRKITLVSTLLLMGTATFLIGCLPDYEAVGVLAPILLTTLRCIQGLGIGGEWGGALLLAVEHAGRGQRGLFGSVPQMAITVGMLLGTVALSLVGLLPEAELLAWGWRIPFLFSAVLVLFGLWIRRRVDETPEFRQAQAERVVARLPIVETLRRHPRAVLQAVGLKVAETAPFYVFATFSITYATHYVGFSRATALNALTLAAILATASIPLMGMLADRWSARRVFMAGTVALMLFAFPYFWLISRGSALWLSVATAVAMAVCWAPITAALGTLYAGMFSTEVRYTGVSLGYQLGAALAGGTAPLVATFLLERFAHSWLPVAAYLAAAGALSLFTIATMAGPHE